MPGRLREPGIGAAREWKNSFELVAVGVALNESATDDQVEIEIVLPRLVLRRIDLADRRVDADRPHVLDVGRVDPLEHRRRRSGTRPPAARPRR